MKAELIKPTRKARRIRRVRKKVRGVAGRPRLTVFRSNGNVYAQIIDDVNGTTICSASTVSKDLRGDVGYGGNIKAAAAVGKAIGQRGKAAGVETVCFDRRGNRFHGRIKALAEAAREAGLKF